MPTEPAMDTAAHIPVSPVPPNTFDNPWRRLPWTLPAGILAWALLLGIVGHLINEPVVRPNPPAPVEAQLVEEPPPPPLPAPEKPAPRTTSVMPPAAPPPHSTAAPQTSLATAPPTATASPPAATPQAPPLATAGNPTATAASGARILSRPMPAIPDDLRDEAFNAAALVRFTIAADGSASMELVKPIQNPRLNRLLLDNLKNWRFFPAIRDGKPIASTQEIVVRFEVR